MYIRPALHSQRLVILRLFGPLVPFSFLFFFSFFLLFVRYSFVLFVLRFLSSNRGATHNNHRLEMSIKIGLFSPGTAVSTYIMLDRGGWMGATEEKRKIEKRGYQLRVKCRGRQAWKQT